MVRGGVIGLLRNGSEERWLGFDSSEDISGTVTGRNNVLDASPLVQGNRALASLEGVYEKVLGGISVGSLHSHLSLLLLNCS